MSLSINYRNTVNIVKVPFPPTISVDEIVKIHLKNGIKNVNQTLNAFMIYRKEYNRVVAKFNLSSKDVSKFVSISWKNEPVNVKGCYQQMAKNVKKCFKKKVPSLCFINSNQVDSANDNHVPLGTVNPSLLNTNQNYPPSLNQNQKFLNDPPQNCLINLPPSNADQNADKNAYHPLLNMEQNYLNSTYFYLPSSNTGQNADHPFLMEQNSQLIDNFKNDLREYEYMTMDDDEFMNHLSEDGAITYKAIIQSLPV
ncbi:3715_t:CDS:1 [Diversispora eburnea]|uniref:3715_t:CDS:1 n=1 Tax=Diversispora eburnea TaxID=1213867 RepID=A0A9N8WIS7_9GLOM|nr:3715_t:CDS:1 [Diversispora eburnea]